MKIFLIILISFLLFNCATTYRPISDKDTYAENINSNDDIEILFGVQGLGKNTRFSSNVTNKNIAFMRLSVTNKSTNIITIDTNSVILKKKDTQEILTPLSPEDVLDKISLAEFPYWFWSLLWVGKTECVDGDCESMWFPVGTIIGAINYFKARGTNNDMEEELIKNSFTGETINPGETISGYLFYDSNNKNFYELEINYQIDGQDKKAITVAYSF